ncbi:MAG: amino acid adenylation domain-containing protein [Methylococcales bacterium]|nr:amino acid adenylation domain-containing protein [Methylococcales bacterium]
MSFFKEKNNEYFMQDSKICSFPISYAQQRQREGLQGEVLEKQLSYWKTQLANLTVLELPTDNPRSKQLSYLGAQHFFHLSAELIQGLKTLSQHQNVTLFMTLLAALQVLLYRYSGQEDIVVGTAIDGRNRQEFENLIGLFTNTLAIRTDLSGTPSFAELLNRVREVCLGAYAHQDIPFEKLVSQLQVQRDRSRHPLFQVMLVLQSSSVLQDMKLPGLTINELTVANETAMFDLSISLLEHADGLTGAIEYSTDLFNAETITRLAGHFQTLLVAIVEHPETAIADLPILTAPELHQLLVEWNATHTDYSKHKCIHQLFEEQVIRTPDAIAIAFEDQQLSYRDLNQLANQLAHFLQAHDVQTETLVAIGVDRSLTMIIGLLGILKAGGAYVPLDPSYPAARLAYLLKDCQAKILLTQSHLVWPETSAQIINIDNLIEQLTEYPSVNPETDLVPDNLAYVIYTSGSTGNPKGVMVSHANVSRLFATTEINYGFNRQDVWTLFHSYAFDFSVWELWGALLYGGKLVVVSYIKSRSPEEFYRLLIKEGVTVLNQTPSAFRQLIQIDQTIEDKNSLKLRYVIFGGEALDFSSLSPWFKKRGDQMPQLINMYGITETTVHVTYYALTKADELNQKSVIGKALPDLQTYILDKNLQPQPIGIPGELHVAGAGVTRGYLNRPELTAEKFIKNPFNDDSQARLYKTGDLARYLPDGTIDYLGRIDHQVKIRGFRIELGEIETELGEHPLLREVVVAVYEPDPGDKRLVAYLVPQGASTPSPSELRDFIKPKLPDYMVPSAFLYLDALPITPNGKLDRKALPKPDQIQSELDTDFVAPHTPVEKLLAEIWCNVLRINRVGIHDNFFELGGHSLLAVQMIVEINKLFSTDLPLGAFYQSPTIAELGTIISSGNQHTSWYSLIPVQTQGSRPPLFVIHTAIGDLPMHLGKDQPLYFLRYGMAAKTSNYPLHLPLLEDLAAHYTMELQQKQPCGPYYLMGFSFGGVVAYEMARQLALHGHRVNYVGLLDTDLTKEIQPQSYYHLIIKFLRLSPNQFLSLVKNKINSLRTPKDNGTDFWPHKDSIGANVACRSSYRAKVYNGRVTLFQASERGSMFVNPIPPEKAWRELLGDRLEVQQISGGHTDMCDNEPHVKIMAAKIRACMDKALTASDSSSHS